MKIRIIIGFRKNEKTSEALGGVSKSFPTISTVLRDEVERSRSDGDDRSLIEVEQTARWKPPAVLRVISKRSRSDGDALSASRDEQTSD